ncbi:MAG: sugar phosphate isomerase/epimerase [Oscillospiraceae bacterium]|nr:sugar phosphate isomerase/epimerase [Oscillospiraceae bacterium]
MKVGLDVYSIREMELSPKEQLDYAKKLGFEGVQFEEVRMMVPNLDYSEFEAIKNYAAELGMYVHVSVTPINPNLFAFDREELLRRLKEDIKIASTFGWTEVRTHMGILRTRLESEKPWAAHLADSKAIVLELRPFLKEHGVRLNIETHSDSTSFEILGIIEVVGSEYVGVTLDTGNLLTHGEYPVAVAERVAPYVHLTHAKDAYLFYGPMGFIRQGCPPGRGVVEWPKIVEILAKHNPEVNLSVEDHKKIFDVSFGDPDWLAWHPDVSVYETGQLMRLAWIIEEKRRSGEVADMLEYEAVPYLEQAEERLTFGCNYLKSLLDEKGLHS